MTTTWQEKTPGVRQHSRGTNAQQGQASYRKSNRPRHVQVVPQRIHGTNLEELKWALWEGHRNVIIVVPPRSHPPYDLWYWLRSNPHQPQVLLDGDPYSIPAWNEALVNAGV